jgi:hypothetical protein
VPWPPCPAGCVPCPFPAPEPPLPPPFVLVLLGVAVVFPPAAPVSPLEPLEPFAVPEPVAPCWAGLLSLPLSLHPSKHISPSRTVAPIIALRMLRSFTRLIDFGTVHCDRLAKMSARFRADSGDVINSQCRNDYHLIHFGDSISKTIPNRFIRSWNRGDPGLCASGHSERYSASPRW